MKTERRKTNRARFLATQPIVWLSIACGVIATACVVSWKLHSFAGTAISAFVLAYLFIKLKGSFFYVSNRMKMYTLFSEAMEALGFERVAPVMAKYMDTICGRFIAKSVLRDTGKLEMWPILKKKAKLVPKEDRLDKIRNMDNYL